MTTDVLSTETKIKDNLLFHRMVNLLMDLGEMDNDELEQMEKNLTRFVAKNDPDNRIFSRDALGALIICLRFRQED